MNPKERLVIDNFFSIGHFEWEIKDFNILTGEMASGKSLCLKLVHFIEQIFHNTIFLSTISKDTLTNDVFFTSLSEKFYDVFHSNNKKVDFCNTKIFYSYIYADKEFDLIAHWNDDTERLEWDSKYIKDRIDGWRGFFVNGNSPDAAKNVRIQIYETLTHDFSSTFPIGTEFIPASRSIAAIANPSDIPDSFLENFIKGDKPFVLDFEGVSDESVNKILHLKNINIKRKKESKEKIIEAELANGRKITPLELSSGQQELIYLLLLIRNLYRTKFIYGETISIFIEEPSAHLFPHEQKETIEYIVRVFRELQETHKNKVRFFISTHSPYVLNVINNMLKKGYLIEKIINCTDDTKKKQMENEIETLRFPHLLVREISAHFIQKEVKSMVNESENGAYLYEKIIEDITQKIDDDYNQVKNLLRQFRR